jgi:hypothetical protein
VIGSDCIGIIAILLRFFSLDLGTDLTAGFGVRNVRKDFAYNALNNAV